MQAPQAIESTIRVAHLTTAHSPFDNRIFYRECLSLVEAGFDTRLIAPHQRVETCQGVSIIPLSPVKGRLQRFTLRQIEVLKEAIKLKADIYHFHDPELILVGLVLKALGKKVVYDIHENNYQSLVTKPYLSKPIARLLASTLGPLEQMISSLFFQVIAERCYRKRFPEATEVLNYPSIELFKEQAQMVPSENNFLYTGGIVDVRGVWNHAGLAARMPDIEVTMAGRFGRGVKSKLKMEYPSPNLKLIGDESYLQFEEIIDVYHRHRWRAGLAIFPTDCVYSERELTKFFEYMALGIPVVCSDFPAWKALIEGHGVGLCVNPDDPDQIDEVISYLRDNPERAAEMGKRGRALALSTFNWGTQADNLISLYRRICG